MKGEACELRVGPLGVGQISLQRPLLDVVSPFPLSSHATLQSPKLRVGQRSPTTQGRRLSAVKDSFEL